MVDPPRTVDEGLAAVREEQRPALERPRLLIHAAARHLALRMPFDAAERGKATAGSQGLLDLKNKPLPAVLP